ncbi:hypothetical protein [Rhodoblastus sp.]|uniref:hypothetical protein n=1 Tax=Rhodoblastus sp. TaxID=1962975 RepID=UPI003F98F861
MKRSRAALASDFPTVAADPAGALDRVGIVEPQKTRLLQALSKARLNPAARAL